MDEFNWKDAGFTCAHHYLLPALDTLLKRWVGESEGIRVLDLGCGNGAVTAWLARRGFDVVGVDPSPSGIELARSAHPELDVRQASAYDSLREMLGEFPLVVSLEVVEHLYDPMAFAQTAFDITEPGGRLILSTPYHGWAKNVAIALLRRFDDHVNPLQVHGHIKFWSPATLTQLLQGAGFDVLEFRRVGRIRPLAKSMLVVARRPEKGMAGREAGSSNI